MDVQTQELAREHHEQEEHWLSLSDLMAGLMMIFLLLSIIYMIKVDIESEKLEIESKKIRDVAILYDRLKNELYEDLYLEFREDLPKWDAELLKDLTIRFKEPEILFDRGSDKLKSKFEDILTEFFPRYVAIITSPKYRDDIDDIRIEGHTSSVWNKVTSDSEAYIKNMALSQARTRSALQYILSLEEVADVIPWLREHVTANGLSSSKVITLPDGAEDYSRSRRVEFRVKTDAEQRIAQILQVSN